MLPPALVFDAAHWFGLWLLERVLREVEDRAAATTPPPEREYSCRCWWCGREHITVRLVSEGEPEGPPKGWLEGRLANSEFPPFWCSRKCWAEDFARDPAVGYPQGADWDAVLDEEPPDD